MPDELKPQSVDSPEFRELLHSWQDATEETRYTYSAREEQKLAYAALIAHINAWRVPAAIDAEEVASVIEGALVEDVLPYHSPEWVARAQALLAKLKS